MKKIYLLIAIAAVVSVVFIACGTKSNSTKADATELAQFEAWKADKAKSDAAELAQFEAWKVEKEKPAVAVVKKSTVRKSAARPVTYKSPVMTSESQNSAKVAKKGWSKAAKGAVIGAAGGAVVGAVINKRNRAAGAVIGGVIGGGGGYVLGRTMDKKDGRY
jgi:hypothetical protein